MPVRTAWTVVTVSSLILLGAGQALAGFEKVPEPGSLSLLASGVAVLAGAGWWLRRK